MLVGNVGVNQVFLNVDGNGQFSEVTTAFMKLTNRYQNVPGSSPWIETWENWGQKKSWTRTIALGDVDSDGWLDVLIGNTCNCSRRANG